MQLLGMLYYSTAMNIVRQYVAIAILLWGYGFLMSSCSYIDPLVIAKKSGVKYRIAHAHNTQCAGKIRNILHAMDCFILPSFFEGLGIVAIEAQASGLLTILSDHVPKEAAITNLAHFLPIDEGTEVWSEFVVKHVSVKESRDNMQMKIIKSGYDIISTAKELEQIYLNMSAEEKND